jgi:hypothetical protein
MAPKRVTRNSPSEAHSAGNPQWSRQEPPHSVHHEEQEVSRHEGEGDTHAGEQPPPPPPLPDLVQVMHNQALLLESLNNAINRPMPRTQSMNEKLTKFLQTKPPTFGGSINHLEADDWLRVIQRKIEPFHCEDTYKVYRMDLPGPTTSVGTRTDYSVGPWDYPACATRHLMAWSTRTTEEKYSVRKLYMSCTV